MIIKTDDFAGVQPILPSHKLSQSQSQEAFQCKFTNGNLQAFRESTVVNGSPSVSGGVDSFFPYRDGVFWITSSHDMDIVRGPIVEDEQNRVYRTTDNTYPQMSYEGKVEADIWFRLGVPAPDAAPTLTGNYSLPSGSISNITDTTPLVVTSASHGLKDSNRIKIDDVIGKTYIDGNTYAVEVVDDDTFKLSGTAANEDFPYEGGGSWEMYRDEDEKETRGYAYTYVTAMGEEGLPSDVSVIDVYADEAVELSLLSVWNGEHYDLGTGAIKRIYRSVTSATGTSLYYIGEVPISTTVFTDDIDPTAIGEPLPSESWDSPPEGMRGLKSMPNGILVGFSGRDVCFSVPFIPHAWPLEYRLSVNSDIVGLGVMGQSVVIATKEQPYIATGTDAASMTLEKLEINQSCTSKQGIVDMGFSVIYPSPDGLVEIGRNGVELISRAIFSRDQWQELNPAEIRAFFWEGNYMFFTSRKGYIYSPQMPTLTELSGDASFYGYNNLEEDSLYFLANGHIYQFENGSSLEPYRWKSKLFRLPRPESFSCAQVIVESGETTEFTLYADGVEKFSKTINDSEPFRLPAGFKAVEWEYKLEGTGEVQAVYISTSMTELQQV